MRKNTTNIFSVILFQGGAIPLNYEILWSSQWLTYIYFFQQIKMEKREKKDMKLSNSIIFTTHLLKKLR